MVKVAATPQGIIIEGRPALIQAGALHYFRLPHPDLWRPGLERMRMAGLNAALIPFPWAYHSPAPGFYDFTGPRDLPKLLDEAERAGLWLIAHLGPWLGLGLDTGGVPVWARSSLGAGALETASLFERAPAFVRHVSAWWDRLLVHLRDRPNLILAAVDLGQHNLGSASADAPAGEALAPWVALLREKGVTVPCLVPTVDGLVPAVGEGVVSWTPLGLTDVSTPPSALPSSEVAMIDAATTPTWTAGRRVAPSQTDQPMHLRSLMARAVGKGFTSLVISPVHRGVNWGWWATAGAPSLSGHGAPLAEADGLDAAAVRFRRMVHTLETLGNVLVTPPAGSGRRDDPLGAVDTVAPDLHADPPEGLLAARKHRDGTVAVLENGQREEMYVHLLGAWGGQGVAVEDISVASESVLVLPLRWQLPGGRLLSTTMEPVLHTVVAGRELVILENRVGGEVRLPAEFRPRHRRGAVFVERGPQAVEAHFDAARVASLVLDGGDHQTVLQLLALAPELAGRVWPLDDAWRKTPAFPATWMPSAEEPARGVVIGPEGVVPVPDGSFRYLTRDKGFGYRWGPWRGSDPHTWLAPISWRAPAGVDIPSLTWESRPGAPEVLPAYDDRSWQPVAPGTDLSMEEQGVDYGFVWYRGHFTGRATAVTLACRHACDLFLNGIHVASLNPPPDLGPVRPKTLPLPPRHLRERNVLACLVENQGRAVAWAHAMESYGLISCELEGASVDAWRIRGGLTGEIRVQGFYGFADFDLVDGEGTGDVTWHRSVFDLGFPVDTEVSLFLYLDQTPTKCYVFLNGQMIGRQWYPRDAERRFWLPDGLLRRAGPNELLIAQWTRGADPGLGIARLEAGRPQTWHTHEAS